MPSRQFGVGWHSMPFNRNKCSLLIDIAWLNKIKVILDYRLASLSYSTSIQNNRLRVVHHFWWQLGWKTWTPKWSYDLLDTFTFPRSIIPFSLCNFNFFSYASHAFCYYDELWNDRCWQTMYPFKNLRPTSFCFLTWRRKEKVAYAIVWTVRCMGILLF